MRSSAWRLTEASHPRTPPREATVDQATAPFLDLLTTRSLLTSTMPHAVGEGLHRGRRPSDPLKPTIGVRSGIRLEATDPTRQVPCQAAAPCSHSHRTKRR